MLVKIPVANPAIDPRFSFRSSPVILVWPETHEDPTAFIFTDGETLTIQVQDAPLWLLAVVSRGAYEASWYADCIWVYLTD